jgi:hypothetical protein
MTGDAFYTPAMKRWLGGYEPVLGPELAAKRSTSEISRKSSEARMKQAIDGTGWGTGTMEGLGQATGEKARLGGLGNTHRPGMAQVHQGKRSR